MSNTFKQMGDRVPFTNNTGSKLNAGDVHIKGDIVGVVVADVADGNDGLLEVQNVHELPKDGNARNAGDDAIWDASAGQVVSPGASLDGSADLPVGTIWEDAAAGDSNVKVLVSPRNRYGKLQPFVFEFDCDDTNGDTNDHTLIPAWMNPHGLLVLGVFGLVTEGFAGDSEDQGVVTVEDEDDNTIGTLTASDAGADAVDDILVGNNNVVAGTSGDAAKTVAAGKEVHGFVSQQTSDSGSGQAGKMKVYLVALPLV